MPATPAESVEWLNAVLVRLWPHMDQAVAKIARETLEPAIQQSAPSALRGVRFERFTLGPAPVRVAAIHAVQASPTLVTLLLDVVYRGTPDISLTVAGLHAGMQQLELTGQLSLELTPLVNTMPIVAAAHASFTNMPRLDFQLTGVVAVTRLYGTVRQAMLDSIAAAVVLPNRITVKFGVDNLPARGDFFSLGYSKPRLLRLTVVEARNLKNTDASTTRQFFKTDLSDPYVIVRLGADSFRTPTVKDNLNPAWHAQHEFLVHSDAQALDVYVFDEDHLDADDELGTGQLTVADLVQQGDVWLDIGSGSAVHLRGEYFTLEADAALLTNAPAGTTRGILSVLVDQAFQLPAAGFRTAAVQATLGATTQETFAVSLFRQVQKPVPGPQLTYETVEVPNSSPEWEQALELPVTDLDHCVRFHVIADRGARLGEVVVPLADLLGAEQLVLRRQFDLDQGAGLFLTLHLSGLRRADATALTMSPALTGVAGPDGSEQWLGLLISSCWQFLNEALETTLRQEVLPYVQSMLPFTVTCEKFRLGGAPPQIHHFRVGPSVGDRGVLICFDVEYTGPCDVQFAAAGTSFGLQRLGFQGTVSVVLQPLLGQSPVVGAVQVSFIDPPHLELDFDGLANVLDWPLVGRVFRQAVRGQLQPYVLPGRTITHFAEDCAWRDLFWELYEPPAGVLRVTVLAAKGLKNTDGSALWSFFRTDVSDPYCVLSLGAETATTTTVSNSLDPVWKDQVFDFVVSLPEQQLTVELFDDDVANPDDFLGRVVVSCQDLIARRDVWLPLMEGPGDLHLSAEWLYLTGDREALQVLPEGGNKPGALLTVLVDQATGLPTEGLAAARVEVEVGPAKKSTRALPLTRTVSRDGRELTEPQPCVDWEEALLFPVPGPAGLALRGTVWADRQPVADFHAALADIVTAGLPDRNALVVRKQLSLVGPLTTAHSALTVTFMLAALRPQ